MKQLKPSKTTTRPLISSKTTLQKPRNFHSGLCFRANKTSIPRSNQQLPQHLSRGKPFRQWAKTIALSGLNLPTRSDNRVIHPLDVFRGKTSIALSIWARIPSVTPKLNPSLCISRITYHQISVSMVAATSRLRPASTRLTLS